MVLFRLGEDDDDAPADDDTMSGSETIHQGLTADDVHTAVREQERAAAKAPVTDSDAQAAAARACATHARRSRGPARADRCWSACWWSPWWPSAPTSACGACTSWAPTTPGW